MSWDSGASRRPRLRLEAVAAEQVVRYVQERTRFRAKATVNGVMCILRGHGDWLVQEGIWKQNPLRWLQGPKLNPFARAPRRLTAPAMERLWQGAATARTPFQRHQWLAILALLYGLGLRRGEIARLSIDNWDEAEGLLLVDGRKTGWPRQLPAAELMTQAVASYLPQRQNHLERQGVLHERALFLNRAGRRLSPTALSAGIHRLAQRAGVPLTSLHQFRHTCASELLEVGVQLPQVKQLLGHQAIGTTVRYLHLSNPARRAAVEKHPLNDWLTGAVV